MNPPDDTRRLEIVDQDDVARSHRLSLQAEVLEARATADGPPRLRVTLTNESDRERTVRANNDPPLPAKDSVEVDPGLVLVPTGRPAADPHPDPVGDGCWQLRERVGGVLSLDIGRVLADDERTRDCTVWGAPENEHPCLPTGQFRFEGTHEVDESENGSTLEWGFTVTITDPDDS